MANIMRLGGGGASGEITITSDGNYDVKKYATANVDVVSLGTRSITANGTYDVTKYASANVNVQSAPVLLWTNASPTSNFAAQTVSIAGSAYSSFLVEIRTNTVRDDRGVGLLEVSTSGQIVAAINLAAGFGVRRVKSVSKTAIVFDAGGLSANDNSSGIPTRIWGVKFTL